MNLAARRTWLYFVLYAVLLTALLSGVRLAWASTNVLNRIHAQRNGSTATIVVIDTGY